MRRGITFIKYPNAKKDDRIALHIKAGMPTYVKASFIVVPHSRSAALDRLSGLVDQLNGVIYYGRHRFGFRTLRFVPNKRLPQLTGGPINRL